MEGTNMEGITMGISVELFPLGTIKTDNATDVTQDVCESVDTSRYKTGVVSAFCSRSTSSVLIVEGSDDGQSFVEISRLDAVEAWMKRLNKSESYGTTARL
jgi:thiamine phosphate synthase YjbQ (UPF0047 family)